MKKIIIIIMIFILFGCQSKSNRNNNAISFLNPEDGHEVYAVSAASYLALETGLKLLIFDYDMKKTEYQEPVLNVTFKTNDNSLIFEKKYKLEKKSLINRIMIGCNYLVDGYESFFISLITEENQDEKHINLKDYIPNFNFLDYTITYGINEDCKSSFFLKYKLTSKKEENQSYILELSIKELSK